MKIGDDKTVAHVRQGRVALRRRGDKLAIMLTPDQVWAVVTAPTTCAVRTPWGGRILIRYAMTRAIAAALTMAILCGCCPAPDGPNRIDRVVSHLGAAGEAARLHGIGDGSVDVDGLYVVIVDRVEQAQDLCGGAGGCHKPRWGPGWACNILVIPEDDFDRVALHEAVHFVLSRHGYTTADHQEPFGAILADAERLYGP